MDWTKLTTSLFDTLQKNMPFNVIFAGISIGSLIACKFVSNDNLLIIAIISGCILVINLGRIFITKIIEKIYQKTFTKRVSDSIWRNVLWNKLTADEKNILTYMANHKSAQLIASRTAVIQLVHRNYIYCDITGIGIPNDYDDVETEMTGTVFNYYCQPFVIDMVKENNASEDWYE